MNYTLQGYIDWANTGISKTLRISKEIYERKYKLTQGPQLPFSTGNASLC